VVDFVAKSGQLLTSIQGTLDKQLGQFAEAVHLTSNENSEFFSNLPAVTAKDFDVYLSSVKEHWSEYRDICTSLIRAKDSQITASAQIDDSTNAFREIPQVFFNTDYKQSGFEQHQIFTQPIRISVQNQGKLSAVLAGYQRKIEQHLVKHLSNVDGLLRSLMSVAVIQSDIAIAQERARDARETLERIESGQVESGFRILLLARRRERIKQVLGVLELCEQVSQAKCSVDSLVRTGDFNAATDVVQATRTILTTALAGLGVVENIRTFIEEHGRNIDNVIETEFSELVSEFVFTTNERPRMASMIESMHARDLLIPCIQLRLKEAISKRLKKELKSIVSLENQFEFLYLNLSRISQFIQLIDKSSEILQLTCLRFWEAVSATGLARCSQRVSAKLNDVVSDTAASVVSSQAGDTNISMSEDPLTALRIPELRSVRFLVAEWVSKIESLYLETFSKSLQDHLSFTSSVLKSASQNGFSPDVDSTITQVALQRLLQFYPSAQSQIDALLNEERWDKSVAISAEIAKLFTLLDPSPSVLSNTYTDGSDSSPSSSLLPTKQLRINKQSFLVVPSGLPIIQLMYECLSLSLTVPGVAAECLSRLSMLVRGMNSTSRELVLEGQMTVKKQKVINATNLALASQLAGMLGQLVALIAKKFCMHYRIDHPLVPLDGSEETVVDEVPGVLMDDVSGALNDLVVQTVMELNDHRRDIHMKLADILISRFEYHLKVWFAVGAPSAGQTPLEGMVKDFTQMYKVLLKSLQVENLKRVFARAFSESGLRFNEKVKELGHSPSASPSMLSELACKVRLDLLFLYQNMLVGESMGGVKSSLNDMVTEMITDTEKYLPLLDRSEPAEAALMKLRSLLN
jgi:hypothetical protein